MAEVIKVTLKCQKIT